jgi:hypothetical protein
MGKKYWPFRKIKNGHEASGSWSGKKPWVGWYVRIEFARRLWEENQPVPRSDANLPGGGWYLNSRCVPIPPPPVPPDGEERRDEVRRRRAILPADLREDPAYTLKSYNRISFGTWEFDARRRAGYLDYFDHEIAAEEDDNDDDAAEAECETSSDGHVQGGDIDHDDGGPAWDSKTQPPDISEEEALAMALPNSEFICGTGSSSSFTSLRSHRGGQ